LAYFLPYIPGTSRAVGQAKELCNTEDEVCYFNIAVCMHGSLAGKTTYGRISPLQKSTKSESLTNFSVLPSPTLPTSKSSKDRVTNVQRPSDRYCVRSLHARAAPLRSADRGTQPTSTQHRSASVALRTYGAHSCRSSSGTVPQYLAPLMPALRQGGT